MKIFLDSIGCRLNQSEIEKMAADFRVVGHQIVDKADDADLVVVNTCAVTAAASSDSRSKLRKAARSGKARVIATGCYATIDPEAVTAIPEVHQLIPNLEKDQLVYTVLGTEIPSRNAKISRVALPGAHKRTRAFIKVQDGCDNHCTFCVTRIARGSNHSVPESEVFEDIESALLGGAKEIVLSGVNLGAWGRDRKPHKNLVWLINQIVAKLSPPRLRLSSLEPWDIQDEFSDVLNLPGFCRHLHLPLQSGSDAILRRMARRTSTEDFARILSNLRRSHPQIAITTDVMVGFPGESEMHFEESINFVKSLGFSGGHVFNYSNRPGTAAEKLPDQIPSMIRKERSKEMRDVINNSALLYQQQFIGSTVNVLWEKAISSPDGFQLSGLTDNYLRIEAFSNDDLYNQIAPFKITKSDGHVLIAEAIL